MSMSEGSAGGFVTPKPNTRVKRNVCTTPATGTKSPSAVHIPATPYLTKLGFGTGVNVYLYERSPKAGKMVSPWAVKRVNKRHEKTEFAVRLEREAAVLRTLDHPNIIGFRGFTRTDEAGPKNLVMEDGNQSLMDLIEKREADLDLPLTAVNIEKVINGVCSALDYLHTKKHIMHGDIKSPNVLIKNDFETVKLCDFGVTLSVDAEGKQTNPDEEYIGTDAWAPMEVIIKMPVITTKADIFAFGLVIFECLALHAPHIDKLGGGEDDSMLQDDSMNEDESFDDDAFQAVLGTRPALPDSLDLDNSYKKVLEIFFATTMEEIDSRPSASKILEMLQEEETGDDSIMIVNMVDGMQPMDDSDIQSTTIELNDSADESTNNVVDLVSPAAV